MNLKPSGERDFAVFGIHMQCSYFLLALFLYLVPGYIQVVFFFFLPASYLLC